jgi:hypothetical protein
MREGSLIFTDQGSDFVNRITNLKWTHVLIWLDEFCYEATPPVVRKTKKWPPKGHTVLVVEPEPEYTPQQIALMRGYADSMLGTPYRLRGYLFPSMFGKTRGIYCSEFACDALRAGKVLISQKSGYTPDLLYTEITGEKP